MYNIHCILAHNLADSLTFILSLTHRADTDMGEKPINVALVGYGYTTRVFHIPAILLVPAYKIHAFVQRQEYPVDKRTGQPGPSCVDDFPEAVRYASMEEMLKDPEVELVVVVTPAESHASLCIQALEAGKNGESAPSSVSLYSLVKTCHHRIRADTSVVIVEKPFANSVAEADEVLAHQKSSGKIMSVFQSGSSCLEIGGEF